MTDEQAHIARAAAALDDKLVIPERFGIRRVSKMYADINKLRQEIRSEGTDTIQEAWDRVEECIDYAYGGCPGCRATHARPSQAGDDVKRLVEALRDISRLDVNQRHNGNRNDLLACEAVRIAIAALAAMDTPKGGGE